MKTSAICIVSHNTRDLLRACVRSALDERPDEVIVFDNASTDGSAEMVKREFPAVRLMCADRNLGYGGGANKAIESSRADDILLLNADTVVMPGALASLQERLARAEAPTILGPRLLNGDGTPQDSCFHFPTPPHVLVHLAGLSWLMRYIPVVRRRSLQRLTASSAVCVPWVLGAALAFRRETFESLGGFDERFFMYFEETDLCCRAAQVGGEVLFVPQARVLHIGAASTRQRQVEMRIQFFASLERFYRKHYSRPRLAQLGAIVKVLALVSLLRAGFLGRVSRDDARRTALTSEFKVQQRLLLGRRDWRAEHPELAAVRLSNP